MKIRGIDIERRLRALDSIEKRERAALERDTTRDQRTRVRGLGGGMPSLEAVLGTETDSPRPDLLNAFEQATGWEEPRHRIYSPHSSGPLHDEKDDQREDSGNGWFEGMGGLNSNFYVFKTRES